jgi:hypothetical protein
VIAGRSLVAANAEGVTHNWTSANKAQALTRERNEFIGMDLSGKVNRARSAKRLWHAVIKLKA